MDDNASDNKSYGKSLFTPKNIIIYLIVAALVYGAVYFLFLSKKGSNPYSANNTTYSNTTAAPTSETTAMSSVVTLNAQNASGENGTATLTEENGQTTVKVAVTNAPANVEQPAHIHTGSCATLGGIVYPLNNLVDGKSTTVLDVSMAKLKSGLPLALNVHKSNAQVSVYTSCGDLDIK